MQEIQRLLKENQDKLQRQKEEKLILILNNDKVREILNKYHWNEELVRDNYLIFDEYYQSLNGNRPLTIIDSEGPELQMVDIEYLTRERNDILFLNNFTYSDIAKDNEELSLKKQPLEINNDNQEFIFLLKQLLEGKRKKGFFLYGDFGVGKTYIMSAFANDLARLHKKVAFANMSRLARKVREFGTDKLAYDKLFRQLQTEYLILDDIGSETISEFYRDDFLFTLLDERMEKGLITCFTSNLDLKGLTNHFRYDKQGKDQIMRSGRLLQRVMALSDSYCLKGKNRRLS